MMKMTKGDHFQDENEGFWENAHHGPPIMTSRCKAGQADKNPLWTAGFYLQ
jgi:hypothetical protein